MGGEPITEFIKWIWEEATTQELSQEDAESLLDEYLTKDK